MNCKKYLIVHEINGSYIVLNNKKKTVGVLSFSNDNFKKDPNKNYYIYVIFYLTVGASHVLCAPESCSLFFCGIYLIVISKPEAAFLWVHINAAARKKVWKTTITRRKSALKPFKSESDEWIYLKLGTLLLTPYFILKEWSLTVEKLYGKQF